MKITEPSAKRRTIPLKRLWRMCRDEEALATIAYRHRLDEVHECCRRRNLLMDAIFHHPDNIYSRGAISSRIIHGLSGHEDRLKDEFPAS
jgi:hypothetical protein